MTAPKEFHGVDFCFAMGEVYGIRTWKLDALGRLRALHVTTAPAWRPGINEATCHKKDDSWYAGGLISYSIPASFINTVYGEITEAGQSAPTPAPVPEKAPEPSSKPPHSTPVESCTCGFYAYTDPLHEEAAGYRAAEFVTGIVRGSGRTLIGTKGFRCEKAEVVALLDATRGGRKQADWRAEQRAKLERAYPDVPLLPSRADLLEFAPIESLLPDPSTDEFWSLP